jgi:beta-lactamase class A
MARYSHDYNYSRSVRLAVAPVQPNRLRSRLKPYVNRPLTASRAPKYRLRAVLIGLTLLILAGHVGWTKHVSAQAAAVEQAHQSQVIAATQKAGMFKRQVAELSAANPAISLSVVIGTDTLGIERLGDSGTYSAASVGKLITAASYLHLVDSQKSSLNQQIDGKTTRYWLNLMLVQSDDVAWQNLNSYVTHAALTRYAATIGLTQYDADTDNFPAVDAAILLQKLQNGTLLSPASQQLMLGWLAVANYRDYIVPAVPSGTTVYHKVGFDGDSLHDAAIIKRGDRSLVLVIFTDGHGNYDWAARTRLIQAITRDAMAAYL